MTITSVALALVALVAALLAWSPRARVLARQVTVSPWLRPVVAAAALAYAVLDPASAIGGVLVIGALTEGQRTGEFILSESPGKISRDTVTVTVGAATTLAAGLVLGRLSATGKYVPYDNAGSDGSETAYGVLYGEIANAAGAPADVEGVVVNWGAEVRKADLQWASGLVDADKLAAYVDLATRGVKARD